MRTYSASSLETRVVRLERTNRFLLVLCLLTASLLLLAHTVPQLAPDVVRAERYQLVDPTGTVKAELRLDARTATLLLLDQDGNVRATLTQAGLGTPAPSDSAAASTRPKGLAASPAAGP